MKFEHPISLTKRSEMSAFLFYVAFRTQGRALELCLYKKSGAEVTVLRSDSPPARLSTLEVQSP